MRKSNMGIIPIIALVMVGIVIFAIFANNTWSNPESPITMTASLKPTTTKEGEAVSLTMQFENKDLNSHKVRIVIDTISRVNVYSGTDILYGNQYSFVIESGDPDETRVLTVKGFLEEGVSLSEYNINLRLYVDENEVPQESQKLELTVKS